MDQITKRLAKLYPENEEETYNQLGLIINEYKNKESIRKKQAKKLSYSEKDTILICYADHIQEEGKKTLTTLHKFLNEYVKGTINKVHFLPFFPFSSDDGFSVIDYYKIKEEFGDWSDVNAVGKDFSLMLDLVINHISAKSEWFSKFLQGDKAYLEYFIAFDKEVDTSQVFRPRTHPLLTPFETKMGKKYVWTTFSADQVDLNFSNPTVFLEMIKVLLFYVEQGAEVIRLDAIGFLWKQLGTTCIHLPQTHEAVKLMRNILEEVAPYVWIITETNVPHKDNISYFGNGTDEAHLVYNFTLPPLLLYTLLSKDSSKLSEWASTLNLPSDKTTFFNFTASHDGIGLTPLKGIADEGITIIADDVLKMGGKVNYRASSGSKPQPYELNIVYLSALGGNIDAFLASQAIALSLQGVPAIYFNSLIGAENWIEGVEKLGYNRAINRQKFDFSKLTTELNDTNSKKSKVYNGYRKLINIRTHEPLFSPHVGQKIISLSPQVFSLVRSNGTGKLMAIINITDTTLEIDSKKVMDVLQKEFVKDLVSNEGLNLKEANSFSILPYQVFWLK